jgi:hypothetical protein
MENKENKIEKAVEKNNKLAKYGVTKKSLYSLLSILFCLALIVTLSFTGAKYKPELLKDPIYWVGVAINSGLCIYGMITGQQMGDDMSRNNPSGQFRLSLSNYRVAFKNVDTSKASSYFSEWLEHYREKKIKMKIRRYLKDNGVHQMEVLDLSQSELSSLLTPWKKDWKDTSCEEKYYNEKTGESITYFLAYNEEQIKVIKECLTGKIKVSQLPESFFLNAFNQNEIDTWESAGNSSKKKNAFLGVSFAYRLGGLFLFSAIFQGLARDPDQIFNWSQVWIDLISRIFVVLTAVVWGIYIGMEMVKIDIMYIDFKSDVLNKCYREIRDGEFAPESIEEKARKQYEKYEKEKPKTEIVMGDLGNTILLVNNTNVEEEKKNE